MGKVFADIELSNAEDIGLAKRNLLDIDEVRKITVRSLVDTGAYQLCINEDLKTFLGLDVVETRTIRFADESRRELEVVGPIRLQFENRKMITSAIVMPGDAEVLLGSIPLEEMDCIVDPLRERLIVNPDHPYMAVVDVK